MKTLTLSAAAIAVVFSFPADAEWEQPCSDENYRALDFWLGDWDVYNAESGALVGNSHVSMVNGGCSLLEVWTSKDNNFSGHSMNAYDARLGYWKHFWVDSEGSADIYEGRLEYSGGEWISRSRQAPNRSTPHMHRWSLIRRGDGTLIQHAEFSYDGGNSWSDDYSAILYPRLGD